MRQVDDNEAKSWLNCPLCPLKQGGDVSGCCVALRAVLRKATQHNQTSSDKNTSSEEAKAA